MERADREAALSTYDRVRGGEVPLEDLVTEYLPRLRAFVRAHFARDMRRRESASDIVQSVCRGVLSSRRDLDFANEVAFRAWLFTAALNKIREKHRYHRSDKRDLARELSPDPDRATALLQRGYASVCTPSDAAAAEEQVDRLESALDRLPAQYREVIAMARIAELPMAEVAARMGRTRDAVQKLLGRALLRLSGEMKASGGRDGADDGRPGEPRGG